MVFDPFRKACGECFFGSSDFVLSGIQCGMEVGWDSGEGRSKVSDRPCLGSLSGATFTNVVEVGE